MLRTLFLPAARRESRRLLVMLHGLGDSVDGYRWLPEALGLPWLNYVLANAPDPYFGGFSWFDFAGNPVPGIRRSTALLVELLGHLQTEGFPAGEITLGGFSQGCLMALETGCRYPHQLAGVVGISGYLHDAPALLRERSPVAAQQRFLVTHGAFDPLLPIERSRSQMAALKAAGLNLQWHEFPKDHSIAFPEELDLIREFIVAGYPPA